MKNFCIALLFLLMTITSSLQAQPAAPQPEQPAPQPEKKNELTVENFEKLIDELIDIMDNAKTLAEMDTKFIEIVKRSGLETFEELQNVWIKALGTEKINEIIEKKKWAEHAQRITKLETEARTAFYKARELRSNKKYKEAAEAYITVGQSILGGIRAACFYNASCAYAVDNDKRKACIWFAEAVKTGFRKTDYIKKDSDLDNIRKEEMYLYILDLLETLDKATAEMWSDPDSDDHKKAKETAKATQELLDNLDVTAMEKKYYDK